MSVELSAQEKVTTQHAEQINSVLNAVEGEQPEVLTHIFEENINLVSYQRELDNTVMAYCQELVEQKKHLSIRSVLPVNSLVKELNTLFPDYPNKAAFIEDLALLIDMYTCLFDLEEVGLRVQLLDRAMCPRFHVDKLGCRLVSTYQGIGSEWLYDLDIDRSKLGKGSNGLSDEDSGLYSGAIQTAEMGDVLLLKGEGWFGNEGGGIVHRSPAVALGERRLVVTLDFA